MRWSGLLPSGAVPLNTNWVADQDPYRTPQVQVTAGAAMESGPSTVRIDMARAAVAVDPAASSHAIGAGGEKATRQLDRLYHALIGEPVVDDPVLPATSHESAPAQAGKDGVHRS